MFSMRLLGMLACVLVLLAASAQTEENAPLEKFPASNAHQGVAIDHRYAYTINNSSLSKYDRFTGEHLISWQASGNDEIIHLNAGIVHDGKLYCAHSNYPLLPMKSSLEIFDPETLSHMDRHLFGETDGSLTWVDWHNGSWWACFAHYSKRGGAPDKGHEHSRFVQFNTEWEEIREWRFPVYLLEKFAPYSASGGAWIAEGVLMVTGHDLPEAYLLRLPEHGDDLEYLATVDVPFYGQAIDFNPAMGGLVYGIVRKEKTVAAVSVEKLRTTVSCPESK